MPTPIDKAMQSKVYPMLNLIVYVNMNDLHQNLFLGFAGIVTAVAAWSIWGQDMFPAQSDPTGEPEKWTEDEMRRWLNAVSVSCSI